MLSIARERDELGYVPGLRPQQTMVYGVSRNGRPDWSQHATIRAAVAAEHPAYAWPGGYVMEYIVDDCVLLCAECAQSAWLDAATRQPGKGVVVGPEISGDTIEEAASDHCCDGCGALIFTQNLCPDHGYQPDAITSDDKPGAYRCPICHPECFPNEKGV